jgi:uncharacterized membrane protein YoaK (UPF0700 family)
MDHRPTRQVETVIAVALTFVSGAMDVASFTRLGSVFASVMTGNIALLGLAVARASLSLASHTAVAIAGYVAGVAGGSLIAAVSTGGVLGPGGRRNAGRGRGADAAEDAGDAHAPGVGQAGGEAAGQDPGGQDRDRDDRGGAWPKHVAWALLAELVLLAGFAVGWEITGSQPAGWAQFCLLATASATMGVQSSAAKDMGLKEVSTTYLTGTLTGLVSSLVTRRGMQDSPRRSSVLLGLAAGASLSGLLIATAPPGVPALLLAGLVTAVILAIWPAVRPR